MNTSTIGGERRLSPRQRPAKGLARVSCQRGVLFLGPNLAASLVDASEAGIDILARAELAAGERLCVSLEGVGHATPFRRMGRVAWCEPAAEGRFLVGVELDTPLEYGELAALCTR